MNFYSLKIKLHLLKKSFFSVRGQNQIQSSNAKKYKVKYNIVGNNNEFDLGESTLHNILIHVRGNNNKLKIEKNCYFKNTNLMFEGNNCEIYIGENTSIESAHIDVKEENMTISIGKDCMFSDEVFISTSDSHSILNQDGERINHARSVIIGENVWIGKRVMILKGSTIGNGAIIAAGSIVNLDGEPVSDEFLADAMNYQILLGKIDTLLAKIGLDA